MRGRRTLVGTLSPVAAFAVIVAPKGAFLVPTRVSAVAVASAVPPAGTVTRPGDTANIPSGASPAADRSRVGGLVPVLR
ncbi:hypothetical protein GCM10022233_87830 [Streptomyces shaanxiensis]|uniref:Secreted protein n=1 Tax=Streptomyces shaanxiensis TaxID=653357 RepID=A0ABP7WLH6_9ACTN